MRRDAKRDTIEPELKEFFEKAGFYVLTISQENRLDLHITDRADPHIHAWVEVKSGNRPVRKGQRDFILAYPGPALIVRSLEAAQRCVDYLRGLTTWQEK